MFTSIDKALVALVMSLLVLAEWLIGWSPAGVSEETVTTIISLLTPILVWLVPNKKVA